MRVVIWHGYLLSGTGSNEYTRALARTLAGRGHEVIVLSQDPDPAAYDLGGARALRPPLPGRLPVFVLDRYPGAEPALLPEMPRAEVEAFVTAQAGAIRELGPADLLVANHALRGGPVGRTSGMPYVVKVHGSELEFAMRGDPELCRWARQSLDPALGVLVGSAHIGRVVTELVGLGPERMTVITPGVDVDHMAPIPRDRALAGLLAEARADPPGGGERDPDPGNAGRLAAFLADPARPTVAYVGKLSEEKGVHLLLEALAGLDAPAGLDARAVVVGFGPARAQLEEQAARLGVDALFTGPLQHRHLRHLWPLADVSVVPSVFPEAFGMVAAEAAATGCPPLVARHSGLAEVASGLEGFLPAHLHLLTFTRGDSADLRQALGRVLGLGAADRAALSAGVRAAVESLWSWQGVADRILEVGRTGPRAPAAPISPRPPRPGGPARPRRRAGR